MIYELCEIDMNEVIKITPGNWELLLAAGSTALEINAMPINLPEVKAKLLIALDSKNCRHLLVAVNRLEEVKEDSRSPGCRVFARELHGHGENFYFADLVCSRKEAFPVFNLLVNDILERICSGTFDPGTVCAETIDDWRDLLGGSGSGKGLSNSQILGLFGELWILKQLAMISTSSIDSWLGPDGNPHDFSQGLNALEVKTTSSATSLACQIHGITQLEPPLSGDLYLALVRLEQRPGVGISIGDLISEINTAGIPINFIRSKLDALGYEEDAGNPFLSKKWIVKELKIWNVKDKFPRIVNDSFETKNMPSGVMAINYSIDLTLAGDPIKQDEIQKLFIKLAGKEKKNAA